ncbi:MAG: CARDB domain-containing protein [Verrucomicrobiota bacterium]
MTEFLLKLLGAQIEDASRIAGMNLTFAGGIGAGTVLLLAVVCGVLTWWFYREPDEGIAPVQKYAMISLRMLFILLLLLLLLRPVLSLTVEGNVRRALVVLFDGTASMKIKDPRITEPDQKRAAIGKGILEPAGGLQQAADRTRLKEVDLISRLDLAKAVMKNPRLNLLPSLQKDFDLSPFIFGQTVQELVRAVTPEGGKPLPDASLGWVDSWTAGIPQTAIGDSVRDALGRKRGQPLAGIFLLTDGGNNSGVAPREIAVLARQENVPLYIYGVGITSPRDIIVANLFAPEVAFVKDEVTVTVRVRAQGMAGESAKVLLKLGDTKVDEKEITFKGDGETVVPLKFTPEQKGDYELQAYVPPRPDETVQDNNSQSQRLRVIDDKIKVLMIEQFPRWEYHYLQAMLLRDRRVEAKVLLFEGDPHIMRGTNSPYLDKFPERKEDLFKYDVVIFGDVDPRNFTPAQLENLGEFVSRFGGAFIMVAGKRFSPAAYRKTVIERMLPVEFEASPIEGVGEIQAEKPVKLELTSAGRNSIMFRLADTEAESAARWKGLPPVYWVSKVSRAKPAAQVFLVDPDPVKESRFGKMPVVALQQYGSGQAMFIGTDNTWRWRRNVGDAYYVAFWGQISQRMGLQRLLGGSKRTQLSMDRQNVMTGERVTVYARLFTMSFEPLTDAQVKAAYSLRSADSGANAQETAVLLRPVPEQPGVYRGDFIAPAPGPYKFFVEHDRETRLDFNVTEPKFELGETAMNEALLKDMAASSGGAFFREEDLHTLPKKISAKTERVRSPVEVDLWSSWFMFLLLLLVVTLEWILRKLAHLK